MGDQYRWRIEVDPLKKKSHGAKSGERAGHVSYPWEAIFRDRPRTLLHLKDNIRRAIADIPVDMLERVELNFRNQVAQCIDNGGRHLADIIFKNRLINKFRECSKSLFISITDKEFIPSFT